MSHQLYSGRYLVICLSVSIVWSSALMGCDRQEFDVDDDVEVTESSAELGTHYTLHVDAQDLVVGEEGEVGFKIRPGDQLEINLDFPWRVDFEDSDSLQLSDRQLSRDALDLSKERAVLPVDVTAMEPGEHRVEARADFSVCNDQRCDIMRDEPVEFIVQASD